MSQLHFPREPAALRTQSIEHCVRAIRPLDITVFILLISIKMTCMKITEVTRINAITWGREEMHWGKPRLLDYLCFQPDLCTTASFSQSSVFMLDIKRAPTPKSVVLKVAIMQWISCGWQSSSVSHQTVKASEVSGWTDYRGWGNICLPSNDQHLTDCWPRP